MLAKSICILLSGKAGVGKTTSSGLLYEYVTSLGYTAITASFASRVKAVAKLGFDWDGKKNELGRKLLQMVGDTGRTYNENIWIDFIINKFIPNCKDYPYDFVIIDDWRFPNEEARIKEDYLYSVYTVRLVAPEREILKGKSSYNDISEVALDDKMDFDFVIKNTDSLELLEARLVLIAENILAKEKIFGGGKK